MIGTLPALAPSRSIRLPESFPPGRILLTALLVIFIITGCSSFGALPGEVDNPQKNAVLCSCECDPASGPVAIPWKNFIATGADDAREGNIDGNQLALGQSTVGLRFQKLGVPPLATITSARVQFMPAASSSAGTVLQVHMVDDRMPRHSGRRWSISTRYRWSLAMSIGRWIHGMSKTTSQTSNPS